MTLDWIIQHRKLFYFYYRTHSSYAFCFIISPKTSWKDLRGIYISLKINATVNQANGYLKMFYHMMPCHLNCNQFKATYVLTIICKDGIWVVVPSLNHVAELSSSSRFVNFFMLPLRTTREYYDNNMGIFFAWVIDNIWNFI